MTEEQLPMLFTGTYTIVGYVPPFDSQQSRLGLHRQRVQTGGRGAFRGFGISNDDEDDKEPVYEFRYSIMVEGLKIHGQRYGYDYSENSIHQADDEFDIVAKIVNNFLAMPGNEKRHPVEWAWLKANATNLNRSKRFWQAATHLNEIRKEEKKVEMLQRRITRAKLVAQLRAFEVLEGRGLALEERKIKWAEISGGLPYDPPHEEEL